MTSIQNIQGWEVLENGKPAVLQNYSGWKQYFYRDFDSALAYTKNWLGEFQSSLPENWQGEKIDYNSYGDTIEIKFSPGIEA